MPARFRISRKWITLCLIIGYGFFFCGLRKPALAQLSSPILDSLDESDFQDGETIEDEDLSGDSSDFVLIPVGILVGNRNVVQSALVRGQEDGLEAVNFPQWHIPFNVVVTALKLRVETLPDGRLEVRSPGLVRQLDSAVLLDDPELRTALTIAQIEDLFAVTAEFDINEFAIRFDVPWVGLRDSQSRPVEAPVILEGLSRVRSPSAQIAAVQQRINTGRSEGGSIRNQGEIAAVGTVLGGSLYTRLNQPELFAPQSWTLNELQYARQGDETDLFLGTQPRFWNSQQGGDYWGATWISRQGFTPPFNAFGSINPLQRLQTSQIGQSVAGEAEPGTLVRLVQGIGDRVVAEILVDSGGIYRFEDVLFDAQLGFRGYRVLLYPDGQLTAEPEVRDITFNALPGQIPKGASAFITSVGLRREFSQSSFVGEFTDIQAVLGQRWGVSEDLTLGVGAVYDSQLQGLADIFWQPKTFPLRVAVSAFTTDEGFPLDIVSDVSLVVSPNLRANFNRDRFSNQFDLNWQASPRLSFATTWGSSSSPALNTRFNLSNRDLFFSGNVSINLDNQLRWNLSSRYQQLQLSASGNELGLSSGLSYHFSPNFLVGHSLNLNYDVRVNSDFLTLLWRYRSALPSSENLSPLDIQLGYGISSQGSGILATAQVSVLPGITLRARYEGISLMTNASSFNLELVSSLNVQKGVTGIGQRRFDSLRTQSGLMIALEIPENTITTDFRLDPNLLILDNQSIPASRVQISGNRLLVNLPPGVYRLDLDPAGYPLDYQPTETAFALEVTPGAYTSVVVPFTPSYIITGLAVNNQGEPIIGARVEAVSTEDKERVFSITNSAGVYYLEGLQQQTYRLKVNGQPSEPNLLTLEPNSEPFQEINLKMAN